MARGGLWICFFLPLIAKNRNRAIVDNSFHSVSERAVGQKRFWPKNNGLCITFLKKRISGRQPCMDQLAGQLRRRLALGYAAANELLGVGIFQPSRDYQAVSGRAGHGGQATSLAILPNTRCCVSRSNGEPRFWQAIHD